MEINFVWHGINTRRGSIPYSCCSYFLIVQSQSVMPGKSSHPSSSLRSSYPSPSVGHCSIIVCTFSKHADNYWWGFFLLNRRYGIEFALIIRDDFSLVYESAAHSRYLRRSRAVYSVVGVISLVITSTSS